MATFVATIDAEQEARLTGQDASWRRRGWDALLLCGLTLFAVAIGGYHPYAEDGGLYAAGVKRLLDPGLYPRETEFVLEPTRWSLFAPVMAGLVRLSHLGLPVVLLLVHLASVGMTLLAAWMLAGRCFAGREARTGAVVLLACWLSLPVAGTALMLMDPYVTARSFSTPCMVLALVAALQMTDRERGRRAWGVALWAASLVVAGVMHPLMAMDALGATLVLMCLRSERRWIRIGVTTGIGGFALVGAAVLQAMAPGESREYVRVALTRTYWFPAEWRWFEWVGLAAPLMLLACWGWMKRQGDGLVERERLAGAALARAAIVVGGMAWVVALLFARVGARTYMVARLQPLRVFQIVYVAMILILGAKLGERVLQRRAWRWCVAMAALGGVMLGAARASYSDSRHLELPGVAAKNAWVQAFVWAREHTPKDAPFALDADYINAKGEDAQCFRAIAERSALADYSKDGGEAAIAPELAMGWSAGQTAQRGLSTEGDAAREAALRPLGVTWVVLEAGAKTSFACPYANGVAKVCRVPRAGV